MPPTNGKTNHLFCHVLSIEPLVVIGYGSPGPFSPALQLCEAFKKYKAYFLLGSWWDLYDPVELSRTVQHYQAFSLEYPKHNFIYLVNEEAHRTLLEELGVPAVFCHQNALIDESLFHIKDVEKSYDAVYNARLDPFKRHLLARKLRSLGLIYYNLSGTEGVQYQGKVMREMPQALHLNMRSGGYSFLDSHSVCTLYNRARVGLCLSAQEGANYATVEYLLSGLPVVSTHNTGGRNHFLQPGISRLVEPTPEAVRDAVQEFIDNPVPPETVRRMTLMRCLAHRITLQKVVQSIYDVEGAGRNFADEWNTVYVNKMLNWGIPDWQVVDYVKKWRGRTDKVVEPLRRNRALEAELAKAAA